MIRPLVPLFPLAANDIGGAVVWCLLIVALLVAGFFAVSLVKRWARSPDQTPAGGFTLGDLRDLHKAGQMSDEEFEKAKAKIVDAAKAAATRQAQQAQQARPSGLPRRPANPGQ